MSDKTKAVEKAIGSKPWRQKPPPPKPKNSKKQRRKK